MTTTTTASRERGAQVRFPPPLVFLAAILLGSALQSTAVAATLPLPRSMRIVAGLALVLCGFALGIGAHVHFRRTGQHPAPWRPSPALIAGWPYSLTRNPMYVGMTLVVVGIGIAVNDAWICALALPALLAVHWIAVLPEERYLGDRFGDAYAAYRASVRRYL